MDFSVAVAMFLMHRVELKALLRNERLELGLVPNAPCGVERTDAKTTRKRKRKVPNAPCGVER